MFFSLKSITYHTWLNTCSHAQWNQIYHLNLEVIVILVVYDIPVANFNFFWYSTSYFTVHFLMGASIIYPLAFINAKLITLTTYNLRRIRKIWCIKVLIKNFNYNHSTDWPQLEVFLYYMKRKSYKIFEMPGMRPVSTRQPGLKTLYLSNYTKQAFTC